ALSVRVIQQNNQSLQYKLYNDAFTGLESALAESWVELETGQDGMVGLGAWSPPVGSTGRVLPTFDDSGVLPEMSTTQPTVEYMAYADDWSSNGEDDDGDGTIDDSGENFTYTVYAFSQNRGIQRNVEVVLK